MQGSKENGRGDWEHAPPGKLSYLGNYFAAEKGIACTVYLPSSDLAIY